MAVRSFQGGTCRTCPPPAKSKHAPWTLVDYNDQKRGRLTLIRDLLDRLPDAHVPPAEVDFPPLPHKPLKERYGVLKPIATFDPES